jgi:hypothetical protein
MYELNCHFEWYAKKEESQWHKVRVLATYIVQPHSKKKISPKDLIPLPSDIKDPGFSKERMIIDMKHKTKTFLNYWQRRN